MGGPLFTQVKTLKTNERNVQNENSFIRTPPARWRLYGR